MNLTIENLDLNVIFSNNVTDLLENKAIILNFVKNIVI